MDFNSSVEGPQGRETPRSSPTPLRSWDPTARLSPACPAKGLPRPPPPRKHLEPLGSDGQCHGTPPLVQPSCPHSYPPLFFTLSCSCASRAPQSPRGPFLAKSPSFGGEARSHLTEGVCPFISLAKNKLSSGMCEAGICSPHSKLSRPAALSTA